MKLIDNIIVNESFKDDAIIMGLFSGDSFVQRVFFDSQTAKGIAYDLLYASKQLLFHRKALELKRTLRETVTTTK